MPIDSTRVILDTDIGTDVDDCLALALTIKSPEIVLEGVTCVYGDVTIRAKMARKLLRLNGNVRIPVYAGARKPMLSLRPVFWAGNEGEGLLEPGDSGLDPELEPAAQYLVRTIRDNPGLIHLVAIGPLTNVATAFLVDNELPQLLANLTIMGGAIRSTCDQRTTYGEHNFISDPEAAHIVLTSGAPITLVPLDVTRRVRIDSDGVERIEAAGTRFHSAVADQVRRYPHFNREGWTYLHDPLAVGTVLRPDLVTLSELHVDVELGGRHSVGVTLARQPTEEAPANAMVALDVDAPEFERFFIERLAATNTRREQDD